MVSLKLLQISVLLLALICTVRAQNAFDLTQSTYLGDAADDEAVVAIAIQSDGDIIVVANLGPTTPVTAGAIFLNGATATSQACVLILSPDGKQVKHVARIGAEAMDAAIDSADRIYIAMGFGGVLALDANAAAVRWTSPSATGVGVGGVTLRALIHRIDVGSSGTVACLMSSVQSSPTSRPDTDKTSGPGTIIVFGNDGAEISRFPGTGGRNVLDVVVDDELSMLVIVGWRQAYDWLVSGSLGGPVQIGMIRGLTFQGQTLWTGYDWHTDPSATDGRYLNEISIASRTVDPVSGNVTYSFLSSSTTANNMADTRIYRASRGEDGELYVTGHSAGGNHMYRYTPMNPARSVGSRLAVYDFFASYAGAKDQHLAFIGRYHYNRTHIDFGGGQGVVARLSAILPNTLHAEGGAIAGDINSRIYLGGVSACCLPFPPNDIFKAGPDEVSLNPFRPTDYMGGAFMLAFNYNETRQTITGRAFAGRVARGKTKAIAVRTIGGVTRIVWGGYADLAEGPMWTADALQSAPGYGQRDAWLVVQYPGLVAPVVAASTPTKRYVTGWPNQPGSAPDSSTTSFIRNRRFALRINGTDIDGNPSTTDARFVYPFSETDPLTPRNGTGGSNGNTPFTMINNNALFYGGMVADVVNVNDTLGLRGASGTFFKGGSSGMIDLPWLTWGTSCRFGEKVFSRAAMFVYTKDLFESDPTDRWTFDSKSSLAITFERFLVWTPNTYKQLFSKNVRFIVRDGPSNWYISERVLSWAGEGPAQWGIHILSFATSNTDGRWASWNPTADASMSFDPTTANFLSVDFQGVQAVGVYIVSSDWCEIPWTKPIMGTDPPEYLTAAEQPTSLSDGFRMARFEATMIKNVPTNRVPVARFSINVTTIRVGDTFMVDARASFDPDGVIAFVRWNFGDGGRSSGPIETYRYLVAGLYTITVTVSDNTFESSSQSQRIYVVPANVDPTEMNTVVAGWWGFLDGDEMDCIGIPICSPVRSPYRGPADLNNDGTMDDYYFEFPYAGAERPLYRTPKGGTPLIGGWRVESLMTTNRSFIGEWPVVIRAAHNNPALSPLWDQNGVRAWAFGYGPNTATAQYARLGMLFAIDKTAFLSGADQLTVTFNANSRLHCGPFNVIGRGAEKLHFAVRDGDQWYLSEYAYAATQNIGVTSTLNTGYGNTTANPPVPPSPIMTLTNPAAARWVAWNPSQSLFAPNSGFETRTWTNVTAFGVAPQLREFTFTRNSTLANWDGMRTAGLWMHAVFDASSAALPVARVSATPSSGNLPLPVNFDASSSTSGADIRVYTWDFGDGVVMTSDTPTTSHAYSFAGVFLATLTIRDELDRESSVTTQITVINPSSGSSGSEISFLGARDITIYEYQQLNVPVARSGDSLGTISAKYRIEHITTTNADVVSEIKRISWASGDTLNKNLTVDFAFSDGEEPLERLRIVLIDPYGGARIGAANTVEIFLADAGSPPLAPQSSDQVTTTGSNTGGIIAGVIVAVVVVAAGVGVAVWKRDILKQKLAGVLKA